MKAISITKTWQGEELCIPSLESIYPYMDKIVYVHSGISWGGKRGNTVSEVIEDWQVENDKENKIINIYHGTKSQAEQYEKALDAIENMDHDYIMLIDTDEVWAKADIEKALAFLEKDTTHNGFKATMKSYIKSPFFRIDDPLSPVVFIRKGFGIPGCRGSEVPDQITIPDIKMHHFCSVRKSFETVWEKHVASCTEEAEPIVDKCQWLRDVWNKLPEGENLLPLANHKENWASAKLIQLHELPETMQKDKFTLAFKDYNFNHNYQFNRYLMNRKEWVVNYDIVVPSMKKEEKINAMLCCIVDTCFKNVKIITTGFDASAATNRNYGILKSKSYIVVMVDDDISGFFPGWADKLVAPLSDPDVVMVSARLLNPDRTPAVMMNIRPDMSKPLVDVPEGALPSSCIAFRNDGVFFDEEYIGSGFEDTDFCYQLHEKYPDGKFVINNEVQLVHLNEMKNQDCLGANKYYFLKKWEHILKKEGQK